MSAPCDRCGSTDPQNHTWVEGDCILPHRKHSRATIGHICAWHVDRHQAYLDEIIELYATLHHVVDQGSVPDDTAEHKHLKRPGSPALMRLDAWVMLNQRGLLYATGKDPTSTGREYQRGLPDVREVLAGWAQNCVDSQGMTFSVAEDAVSTNATLLKTNAEHIATQPWVDDYDAELTWLRRTLRNAHGVTDVTPLGRCITVTDGRECTGRVWPMPGEKPKCDRCSRRYGTLDLVRLRKTELDSKETA